MSDEAFWSAVTPQELQSPASYKKLSKRIRTAPLPDSTRAKTWRGRCLAVGSTRAGRVAEYAAALALPQLDDSDKLAVVVTWFACRPEHLTALALPAEEAGTVRTVLAAIAALGTSRVGTGRQYSPWLPPVLTVALRWMDPVDTFALGVALLPALSPPGTGVPESVLLSTKLESWRMLFVFSRLADKKLSTEKKQLLAPLFRVTGNHVLFGKGPLGPGHPYEAFVAGWIWLLPEPTLTWALDCLFVEGEKLLYRLGLGIMKECARKLAGGLHGEPGGGLETLLPRLTDATKMMATAYSFKFGQAKMARQRRKGTPVARHAMGHTGRNIGVLEEAGPVSDSMGIAREVSKFAASDSLIIPAIPKAGISALWRQLPVRHQGCEAYRMFSNAQDGSRLETLYSCCADFGPLLLLFKAANGAIFGAFLAEPLSKRKPLGKYFGTGETFVFQMLPEVAIYPWAGIADPEAAKSKTSSFFVSANSERLGIGGGGCAGHAIEIDRDLNLGLALDSSTFANRSLAGGPAEFACAVLEAWVLQEEDLEGP